MKNVLILFMSILIFPFSGFTQVLIDIEEITPFHEEVAAIRKGNKWAFINTNGEIIIDYRDDLVWHSNPEATTKKKSQKQFIPYPSFSEGLCMIKQMKNGVYYYGYIDKRGKTSILPEFLNATSFNKGYAIVLKVSKEELGRNHLLHKKVVSYSYDEVIIDSSGTVKIHLTAPKNFTLTKNKLKWPPAIESHFIAPNLVAVKNKNNSWNLQNVDTSSN
ncbi:hypothetical protein ATO12_08520 [Aquimarina atlantica]|uniref:WG repeat-containing protein n=1 Tax=Aquimarina atlantica TaxID=1317122 RepID=A0A023BXV0_9FLAO|nr:WG repeat-containing protein [Aquimarina atlantica]EZH74774.1 hypothetical protein ATO12_08520 [Aquimarina atlantica]